MDDPDIIFLSGKHEFKLKSILGKGGFGNVFEINVNGNWYAWKIIKVSKNVDNKKLQETIKRIEDELVWSKNLKSQYCIKTYSIFKDEINDKIIYSSVMEKAIFSDLKYWFFYYYNGNLLHINNSNNLRINLIMIHFFLYQIIQILFFLKEQCTVHCDIKSENLLIGNNFQLKISDFSVLKLNEKNKIFQLTNSTFSIKGPEYYNENKEIDIDNSYKVDIYGAGLIIFHLIYKIQLISDKKFFFDKTNSKEKKKNYIIKKINEAITTIKNDKYLKDEVDFKDLLISMIQSNISDRASIEYLLNNKWVNKNIEIMEKIKNINDNEEIKLFVEYQKYKRYYAKRKKIILKKI